MPNIEEVLERDLTPEQRGAAKDTADEVLCLACAGSGKSRTLAYRIARLITEGEDPHGIVAFTFTEKAAEAIKRAVSKALEAVDLDPMVLGAMYIGTIHSYCHYVLGEMDARYREFDVLDENRLRLYLLSRYWDLDLNSLKEDRRLRGDHRLREGTGASQFRTIEKVSEAWQTVNDEMIQLENVTAEDPEFGRVLEELKARLDRDQYIDFSFMIRRVVDALRCGDQNAERAVAELRHLMVDEYQDVNPSQEALIEELHKRSSTLFVVGDDDQAIYAWRGADVNNILTFEDRYPDCSPHTLPHNFRSTQAIVKAADDFADAELGATRMPKNPTAEDPEGPRDFRKLWFTIRAEEAEWVVARIASLLGTAYIERGEHRVVRGLTPGDFAILMRSTRSGERDGSPRHDAFTQLLLGGDIPYTLEAGGGVFDRPEIGALQGAFELLRNGSPSRPAAQRYFNEAVLPVFPHADFGRFTHVLRDWGRLIHGPISGPRRRVYPQKLVHDLLNAFGIDRSSQEPEVMQVLGLFSRIIQDVETVYMSIDTAGRFRELLNFLKNVAEEGYDISTDDVLRLPDLVTVSTVHKAKGLEFPVVFVVDIEAGGRFPGRQHGYDGWLPPTVIGPALERGAYRNTLEGEARLFYTAITRAERYLHITGSERLPGGVRRWKESLFSQRLDHPEVSTDPDGLPDGLTPHEKIPRIDETIVPTSFSEIRYYLCCPRDYRYRKSFGFSPPISEMFGFGKTVHTAVGKLHEVYADRTPTGDEAEGLAQQIFHLKHVPRSGDPEKRPGPYERAQDRAGDIVRIYAETYADDFAHLRQMEVPFEVPVKNAVISGSIDLILKEDEEGNILDATIIEFKVLEGGEEPEEEKGLHWTELALQVQLYANAARQVLGENAQTGAVHLLKDNKRVEVPVTDEAIQAAVENVRWVVDRIIEGDFPMRPHRDKCEDCDFRALCPKVPEEFKTDSTPPPIHIPSKEGTQMTLAFSEFEQDE